MCQRGAFLDVFFETYLEKFLVVFRYPITKTFAIITDDSMCMVCHDDDNDGMMSCGVRRPQRSLSDRMRFGVVCQRRRSLSDRMRFVWWRTKSIRSRAIRCGVSRRRRHRFVCRLTPNAKEMRPNKHPQEHINSYVLVGFHSCQSFLSSRVVCVTAVSNLAAAWHVSTTNTTLCRTVLNPHSACAAEGCEDNASCRTLSW